MRSSDEQLNEIMLRAKRVKEQRRMKKTVLADAIASGVCLALLIAVAVYLPHLTVAQGASAATQYGSLLLAAPCIGYVIVGLLAFALGVTLTLLCAHWKKWKERK